MRTVVNTVKSRLNGNSVIVPMIDDKDYDNFEYLAHYAGVDKNKKEIGILLMLAMYYGIKQIYPQISDVVAKNMAAAVFIEGQFGGQDISKIFPYLAW